MFETALSALNIGTRKETEINVIDLLKNQHRVVEDLFAKLEETSDRARKLRVQLFEELAANIESHALSEEKHFYPVVSKIDAKFVIEGFEEHGLVRLMMKHIRRTKPRNAQQFMARVKVLKDLITHHVEEEENQFFPKIENSLPSTRLEAIGKTVRKEFDANMKRLMPKAKSQKSPKKRRQLLH